MTRTPIQKFANDFDLELFRLAERARAYSEKPKVDDWLVLAVEITKLRRLARKHMNMQDREATA